MASRRLMVFQCSSLLSVAGRGEGIPPRGSFLLRGTENLSPCGSSAQRNLRPGLSQLASHKGDEMRNSYGLLLGVQRVRLQSTLRKRR